MQDSAVLDRRYPRVVSILLGTEFKALSFELRRFRASDPAEITAGMEPAKRLFFRESIFARERKQQSLKEETWQ